MPLSGPKLTNFLNKLPPLDKRWPCQEAGEAPLSVPGEWIYIPMVDVTFYVPQAYLKRRRWERIIDRGLRWELKSRKEE
jgi:hypothetical protein